MPWRFECSVEGRGQPDGNWVVGGGGRLGPLAISAAAARGIAPRVQVHVLGRAVWRRTLAGSGEEPEQPKDSEDDDEGDDEETSRLSAAWDKLSASHGRFTRWLDPNQALAFVVAERRRVSVERLAAHLEYSFADIATTGKLMGAVYALSGVIPPPARLTQVVSWEATDRASMKLAVSARVWPLLLVLDASWFLLRNLRWRKPPTPAALPAAD